ncbi:MAG: carboxypeptidase-like regulatory domain-containing protein, partial [Cyclobacteriaceae bacterium]
MKYLLGICLIFSAYTSYSQEAAYQVEFYRVPLGKALSEVSAKYQLKFSYDPELVRTEFITVNIREKKLQKFTEQFLAAIPFKTKRLRDVLIILPEKVIINRRLTGRVTDAENSSPLAYAVVQTNGKGLITDQSGQFSINISGDSVLVAVSYLGYETKETWILPNENNVSIELQTNDNQLPEFIIDGNRQGNHKVAGFTSVNPSQISTLPSLGETDIFKS